MDPRIAHWTARLGEARPLHFAGPDAALDLPAHVRAGSGLRRFGGHLVVVQDDVSALARVDLRDGAVTPLLLPAGRGGRRHFSAARGNKADKRDLEACTELPDGRLLVLPSGSTAAREVLVLVAPDETVSEVDGRALFAHLRARLDFSGGRLNLEGCVVRGAALLLFQRGNGAGAEGQPPVSAVGSLSLPAFLAWLAGAGPVPELLEVTAVDLGQAGGVPYGFTDAAPLPEAPGAEPDDGPDGQVAFLAGAEASPDTYHDGAVLGARIGLLRADGGVVLADILGPDGSPTPLKLEGLVFEGFTEAGGLSFQVVADMDDPDVPAVLAPLVWGPVA